MFTRPPDLAGEVITDILRRRWGLGSVELDYLPVGFGSHHWRATDAADRACFSRSTTSTRVRRRRRMARWMPRTNGSLARTGPTYALRQSGRAGFVVAPTADRNGFVIARVSEGYSMVVQPHLSGRSLGGEDFDSWTDRAAIVGIPARLHGATDVVRPSYLRGTQDVLLYSLLPSDLE